MHDIVVVGGSIAGFTAASELRSAGFEGRVRVVGDEPIRTYERPPLSKGVLAGDDADATAWTAATANDLEIDWLLGEQATSLDVAQRAVGLRGGDSVVFDGLVIASGATPRRLRGQPDLAGIHVVRSLDDALGLRADLDAGAERVVVVGAGFIGAEVAATCRGRGHQVTIVEPLDQPLMRVLGSEIGAVVASVHRAQGVDVRLGVGVDGIEGNDRVEAVRLSDGSRVEADVVVIGIGVIPNTGWLDGSGLPVDDGVVADSTCLVAPGIVACGDVAKWDSPRYGPVRIEHWDHAAEMGRAAGLRLLASDDDAVAFDPVPWFWSDQYDVRLQLAGRADGDMAVVHGSIDDGKFVALYGRDGMVTGALGWNWPAKTVRYRMALESGLSWDEAVA
ncbi:NAD(P)/FAD-dependent oxidoreductase [Actinospongicola halichondriae]|uniref:NAD(P)/FAD-dependent oxidoreductase n=1 Tax=Actinospongicola halichondriae TaxID=3236844 RepID=UPI003D39C13C